MTLFFRVEDRLTRIGPYQQGDGIWDEFEPDTDRHPSPYLDGLWKPLFPFEKGFEKQQERIRSEVCGFGSMAALKHWFDDDMLQQLLWRQQAHTFIHTDYVLAVYDVPARYVRNGFRQSVARKDYLRLKQEISLEEYLTRASSLS